MDAVIRVENLVNRFGDQVVHDHLCLEMKRNEILGLVGGSGSGKSVLMRSILGLQQPTAGRIEVLGHEIAFQKGVPSRQIGVLFQSGALLSGLTVQENVELPMALHSDMPVETRHELASLKLLMVGLPLSAADKYPSELSGGMKKRAALARAMALEPGVLLLDEPTAGLDPIAATEFDELISYLHKSLDLSILMITHDLDSLFSVCDRIAVLVDGGLIVGTVEEIFQSSHPWIASYFGVARAQRAHGALRDRDRD